jgi:hypothetical protein
MYGQIAESKRINEAIYDCFDFLDEKEQKKFVKKFKDQPHYGIQVMHTFRELLLGAYLSASSLKVVYDRDIFGKTPDWSLLDESSKVIAIVEMVYHHLDRDTEDDLLAQREAGKIALGYFPHSNDPEFLRLYSHVQEKVGVYKNIVAGINVPYVVAVFMDFTAVIDVQETKDCLMSGDEPLFKSYPDLSGVLHFEENGGSYYFTFIENPYAIRKIDIPSGYLQYKKST